MKNRVFSYLITGQVPVDPGSQAVVAAGMLPMSSPFRALVVLLQHLSLDGLLLKLLLLLLLLRRVILRNAVVTVAVVEVAVAVPADRRVAVHDQLLLLLLAEQLFLRHLTQLRVACA